MSTAAEYTQARLRINREGALLLLQLLVAEEQRLLVARSQADDKKPHNMALYTVRRVKAELARTLDDREWN